MIATPAHDSTPVHPLCGVSISVGPKQCLAAKPQNNKTRRHVAREVNYCVKPDEASGQSKTNDRKKSKLRKNRHFADPDRLNQRRNAIDNHRVCVRKTRSEWNLPLSADTAYSQSRLETCNRQNVLVTAIATVPPTDT